MVHHPAWLSLPGVHRQNAGAFLIPGSPISPNLLFIQNLPLNHPWYITQPGFPCQAFTSKMLAHF
jgi:hypothetical protein